MRRPTTPGQILYHEFMKPLNLSPTELADRSGMSVDDVIGILCVSKQVTIEDAKALGKAFDVSDEFWLNLQMKVDEFDANLHKGEVK